MIGETTGGEDGKVGKMAGRIIRWIVRGLSLIIGGLWLIIAVMEGRMDSTPMVLVEFIMAALIALGTIGIVLAWIRERSGGIFLAVVAMLHAVFAAVESGHNHLMAVLIAAGPYALLSVGFLLLDRFWPIKRVHPSEAVTLQYKD